MMDERQERGGPATVLVVDDEAGPRLLLEHLVASLGHRALTAADAEEAVSILHEAQVDLAIVDKNLPGRTGLDLLAEIKAERPLVEVIIITGYASVESVITALRMGAGDYLEKPLPDLDILGEKLIKGIERGRAARERARLVDALRARERELEETVNERTRQLRDALDELQSHDRDRRRLVATVAHDLRTPLTALSSYVDVLAQRDPPPEKRANYLKVMTAQCRRLRRLTQDLVFLARQEHEALGWQFQDAGTDEVIAQALEELQPLFERAELKVQVEIAPGAERVRADVDRVIQVLANLLGNAIKFSPKGSQLWVHAAPVEGGARLSVSDQGPGIPADRLEHIFERYVSVDTAQRGEGLGLSICKDIVQAHGGEIWAENLEGRGARFSFLLPSVGAQG